MSSVAVTASGRDEPKGKRSSQKSAQSQKSTHSGRSAKSALQSNTPDATQQHGNNASSKNAPENADDIGDYTTVMLRNIPNKYTREMLVKELRKQGFTGKYDFLYLPTDFANDANPGYCFVDFRTNQSRKMFEEKFDGKSVQDVLPAFRSHKICQVKIAKHQGLVENVKRLRESSDLMKRLAVRPHCTPLMYDDNGNQITFETPEIAESEIPNLYVRPKTPKSKGGSKAARTRLAGGEGIKQDGVKSSQRNQGTNRKSPDKNMEYKKMDPDEEAHKMVAMDNALAVQRHRKHMNEAYVYAYYDWMSTAMDSFWYGSSGSPWNNDDDYWGSSNWQTGAWSGY
eukprot:GEMP01006107.1.p1 GENE.GEMP01006107.1~~GEMP01006107.1.p1  ORF type:complete len:341 (+),score=56.30 GEMP01006107.1:198-1220(+)